MQLARYMTITDKKASILTLQSLLGKDYNAKEKNKGQWSSMVHNPLPSLSSPALPCPSLPCHAQWPLTWVPGPCPSASPWVVCALRSSHESQSLVTSSGSSPASSAAGVSGQLTFGSSSQTPPWSSSSAAGQHLQRASSIHWHFLKIKKSVWKKVYTNVKSQTVESLQECQCAVKRLSMNDQAVERSIWATLTTKETNQLHSHINSFLHNE